MRGVVFVEGRFRSERDEFESSAASRDVTIGFPPDRGAAVGRGAPVAFAGQGDAIWATSANSSAVDLRNGREGQSAPHSSQWEVHFAERGAGNRDHSHGHRSRGEWLFGEGAFGPFGYPFYGYGNGFGYGVGLFSDCANGLFPDWESKEYPGEYYDGSCNVDTGLASQNPAIAADGPDQLYSVDNGSAVAGGQRDPAKEEDIKGSTNEDKAGGSRQPDTLIYLADGTNYAATSYWLAGGKLHYMTSYGAEDEVPIGQVDLQRTVDANAAQGVQFTLRPALRAANPGGKR